MSGAPEKVWVHYEPETDDAIWSEYPDMDGLDEFNHYGERDGRMTKRYRKGMRLKAKLSNSVIVLVNRASGNRHWNTQKTGSKNNHKIHEGTLDKFYSVEPSE